MKFNLILKNKERIIFLVFSFCVLFLCVLFANLNSYFDKYNIHSEIDTSISENLLFKVNIYKDKPITLLSLKDSESTYNAETGVQQSFYIGEYCISLTSMLIDSNNIYNTEALVKLLNNVYDTLDKQGVKLEDYTGSNYSYIISKSSEGNILFVDFLTPSPTVQGSMLYNRFIIQNVKSLNLELKETDYVYLKNILPEIENMLSIRTELSSFLK